MKQPRWLWFVILFVLSSVIQYFFSVNVYVLLFIVCTSSFVLSECFAQFKYTLSKRENKELQEEIRTTATDAHLKNKQLLTVVSSIPYPMLLIDQFGNVVMHNTIKEICVSDKNGVIIFCNKSFEENYGISKSEMIGKNVEYLENHGYATKSPIPLVIQSKNQVTVEQETHTGKNLLITATPVFSNNGEIEYVVENVRDITELNKIKTKLQTTEKEMNKYKSEVETFYRTTLKYEDNIISDGPVMQSIMQTADQVSKANVNIMLLGESGTGKSSLAKFIHQHSHRANGPFITINCAAISPQLLESELFGYTSGAFTGASSKGKVGLVELANGGTLFLDEIGDIPLPLQAKFLQLIQEKTFLPVGGIKQKKVDIRIISATNADILAKVKERTFREDLYYRLNVIEIKLPPLRDRGDNLLNLIRYYFKKYSIQFDMKDKVLSDDAIKFIASYKFPGNIRELQNIMQNIVLTSKGDYVDVNSLPEKIIYTIKNNNSNKYDNLSVYNNSFISDFDSCNDNSIKNKTDKFSIDNNIDSKIVEDSQEKNTISFSKVNDINFCIDEDNLQDFNNLICNFENKIISEYYNKYKSSYKIAEILGISQSKASRLIRKHIKK